MLDGRGISSLLLTIDCTGYLYWSFFLELFFASPQNQGNGVIFAINPFTPGVCTEFGISFFVTFSAIFRLSND